MNDSLKSGRYVLENNKLKDYNYTAYGLNRRCSGHSAAW